MIAEFSTVTGLRVASAGSHSRIWLSAAVSVVFGTKFCSYRATMLS